MKTKRLQYAIYSLSVLILLALWLPIGEFKGAFLAFSILALALALLAAVVGYIASNVPGWVRYIRGISWEEHLKNLEQKGAAVREYYQTSRSLAFEDLNTGSLVHLIDVGRHGLLCLHGQQYFDFEPIDEDPDSNQSRQFPTKEFSLLRSARRNDVLALYPGQDVFAPIILESRSNMESIYDLGIRLEDGEIVVGVTFETILSVLQPDSRVKGNAN